jgi:hypothetical protein
MIGAAGVAPVFFAPSQKGKTMQKNDALVVPFFKSIAEHDPVASKEAGRPIYHDREVCEIRIAGERNYVLVVPVNAMWVRDDNGDEITYAMRWPKEYARFQEGKEQIADGTPLSELPFLSEAKRAELRGLKIYTAEALASLDGKNLKALGVMGRELKTQAEAYLETSAKTGANTALAAEIEALRAEIAALRGGEAEIGAPDEAEKEAIKTQIAAATGARPRGNPSLATLREMLASLTVAA